jgi:flavodoxin
MAALVVYDSIFGNTGKIARVRAAELGARAVPVSEAGTIDWTGIDLLVVGSPTRGFRPTPAISEFCSGLAADHGKTLAVAAFDTRIALETIHPAPLRWVVDAGGYAADRIIQMLAHQNVRPVGTPAGFIVTGQEGPLADGEIERAQSWAHGLKALSA